MGLSESPGQGLALNLARASAGRSGKRSIQTCTSSPSEVPQVSRPGAVQALHLRVLGSQRGPQRGPLALSWGGQSVWVSVLQM